MSAHELRVFLSTWLRSPRTVGAIWPSGPALARAMAAQVDPTRPGLVIELGAGTGSVTRALLGRGVPASRLLLVERDPAFCRLLRRHLPGVTVIEEDAGRLRRALAARGTPRVCAVVSSLPLLALPFAAQRRIVRESARLLAPGGRFVQFTYGRGSPVHPALMRRLGLTGRSVSRVWRNLPPAVVWSYTTSQQTARHAPKLAA
jgi:phosphatidylethanolamine/phosphatidyl-N-methylethanolamine N-methyltransferase